MPFGYTGKIVRVNLSCSRITVEEQDDLFYRTYLGGKGLISYYLLKELEPDVEPLSPENKLIFATGIMTGLPVAAMCRFVVGAKSPLTGGFGQSEAGGFWGPELKKAGYDAVIIEGRAQEPVYLYINDDEIEIKPAGHLWGKDTGDTQDIIRQELGIPNIRIAQIGQGGENLVKYACILNELKHANGRNGLGAVMGSKNLKAIAVKGSKEIKFADTDAIKEISKSFLDYYMKNPMTRGLHDYGTSALILGNNKAGMLPTKNFIEGEFEDAEKIDGETMAETILKERKGCYSCAIRCKRSVEINNGELTVDPRFGGPEYETLGSFGSLCRNNNLEIISKANELCNRYGIDTISTGASIAFAMECYDKGLLSREEVDGLDLSFGNEKVILTMIEKIANRQGIGDLLAEGTKIAADKIGRGAQEMVMAVKGQELPMHDPRGKVGVGIGYAVSEIGADHMTAAHDPMLAQKGFILDAVAPLGILEPLAVNDLSWRKVRMYTYLHFWWSFFDMAGICYFGPVPRGSMPIEDVVKLVKAATGWDTSLWEILKSGERTINMARSFNIREGITSDEDTLPERLFKPLENGRLKGTFIPKEDFKEAISSYYSLMGWNEDGTPSKGKLLELNLDWLVENFY